MANIYRVVFHHKPHIDEVVAYWLLMRFGEQYFPGITKAERVFRDAGAKLPQGKTADQYEQKGVLLLGIGGGLDEHPNVAEGVERKEGECCATLTAQRIGVQNDPALKRILAYTKENDLSGDGSPFSLGNLVIRLHRQHPHHPDKVLGWTMMALDAEYAEQKQFHGLTKEAYEKSAQVEQVPGPRGMITLVSMESDDDLIGRYARAKGAHIVVQRRSTGHVTIHTNRNSRLQLVDVARMVRFSEQMAEGNLVTTNWKVLAMEGKVPGAEEWHYFKKGEMLLNGSLTALDVPPTLLTLERIKEIIRIAMNPDAFEPRRAETCRQGICVSSLVNPCPWYDYGLGRCQTIRYRESQAARTQAEASPIEAEGEK